MIQAIQDIFKRKLHIFYRHVHIEKSNQKMRPTWFSFENCFTNLISSISNDDLKLKIDLVIMFDGDENTFNKDFLSHILNQKKIKESIDIEVVKFQGGSDGKSFHTTIDYANKKRYSDNDLIYFLENDYLHVPNWVDKLHSLLKSPIPFDYVSLYDHKDKYQFSERFHNSHLGLMSKLYVTDHHHWRTTPSTCASFIVNSRTLREDSDLIKKGGMDHQFFEVLNNKGRILLSPIPGLSTHLLTGLMSPIVDWEEISKESKANNK